MICPYCKYLIFSYQFKFVTKKRDYEMAQDGYVTAELIKNAFLGKIARERTLIEFFRSSGREVLPFVAERSPTNEFIFVILQSCFIEILIA